VSYGTITKTQKLSQCAADEDSSLLSQTPVGSIRHYPEDGGRKSGRNGVAYIPYILESYPHPNLISTSFCRFLIRRKSWFAVLIRTFPSTAPCLQGRLIIII